MIHSGVVREMTDCDAVMAVLCVDDEQDLRREIAEGLESAGCTVYQADSGRSGQRVLLQHPEITVVLTDVRMADGDGMWMAGSILSDRRDKEAVEVVVLTGHADVDMVIEAVRIKVFEFLRKPARLRDIVAAVRRAHQKARARRDGAAAQERIEEALRRLADLEHMQPPPGGGRVVPKLNRAVINDALRNPLVPIAGFAELIETSESGEPRDRIVEYARQIRLAGAHLTTLMDGIATLIAVWSGGSMPVSQMLDAGALTAALRDMAARNADNEVRPVRVDIAPAVTLRTDPGRLRLILELLAADLLRLPGDDQAGLAIESVGSGGNTILRISAPARLAAAAVTVSRSVPESPSTGDLALRHRSLGLGTWLAIHLAQTLGVTLDTTATPEGWAAVNLSWHGAVQDVA